MRWLALVLLAGSQLALAAHQLQHDATHPEDTCAACLQLDRDDQAASGDIQHHCPASLPKQTLAKMAAPSTANLFTHFRARASP